MIRTFDNLSMIRDLSICFSYYCCMFLTHTFSTGQIFCEVPLFGRLWHHSGISWPPAVTPDCLIFVQFIEGKKCCFVGQLLCIFSCNLKLAQKSHLKMCVFHCITKYAMSRFAIFNAYPLVLYFHCIYPCILIIITNKLTL